MTIKEAEEQTGLARSNIRFYEKEKLIEPSRNDKNGYRDYSERDIENIKKIAYLRTLEISIEDIRNIISDKMSLTEIAKKTNWNNSDTNQTGFRQLLVYMGQSYDMGNHYITMYNNWNIILCETAV